MSLLEQPPRTFMVADLNNFYGNLTKLPEAMNEAMEHTMKPSYRTRGELDRTLAQDVAEEYAEKVFYDWDCPADFDLIIWEAHEEDEPRGPVFRVKIGVRYAPLFHDSYGEAVNP